LGEGGSVELSCVFCFKGGLGPGLGEGVSVELSCVFCFKGGLGPGLGEGVSISCVFCFSAGDVWAKAGAAISKPAAINVAETFTIFI
jgi:hypothetical protein